MAKYTIEVNLDKKCTRCGKGGACQSGLCMKCITKAVQRGEFDHIIDKVKREHGQAINLNVPRVP